MRRFVMWSHEDEIHQQVYKRKGDAGIGTANVDGALEDLRLPVGVARVGPSCLQFSLCPQNRQDIQQNIKLSNNLLPQALFET